ncbi:MAG TPA: hypothetical protein VI094_21655 [Propionibacteriaceae bacterium]
MTVYDWLDVLIGIGVALLITWLLFIAALAIGRPKGSMLTESLRLLPDLLRLLRQRSSGHRTTKGDRDGDWRVQHVAREHRLTRARVEWSLHEPGAHADTEERQRPRPAGDPVQAEHEKVRGAISMGRALPLHEPTASRAADPRTATKSAGRKSRHAAARRRSSH